MTDRERMAAPDALNQASHWIRMATGHFEKPRLHREESDDEAALFVGLAQACATYALALITQENGGTVTVRAEGSF